MSDLAERLALLRPLVERCCTSHCWIKTPDGPRHRNKPFTEAEMLHHAEGKQAYGLCPITPGRSVTRVAVLDLDSHKGETTWDDMKGVADVLCCALELDGYNPVRFRSSGGAGVHIFLIWDEPQDAASVRAMLVSVLASCGLKPGTAGVGAGEVEVFPKQSRVPHDGSGSMFILPFAGKSELL